MTTKQEIAVRIAFLKGAKETIGKLIDTLQKRKEELTKDIEKHMQEYQEE